MRLASNRLQQSREGFLSNLLFQKKFHRTDSGESSNSSLASFGLSLLYRNNSRKTQRIPGHFVPPPPPSRGMVERNDSAGNLAIEIPSHPPQAASSAGAASAAATATAAAAASAFDDAGSKGGSEEVTIVVGRRKNSTTKAVRYSAGFWVP